MPANILSELESPQHQDVPSVLRAAFLKTDSEFLQFFRSGGGAPKGSLFAVTEPHKMRVCLS
jgi:hypothetical protein